MTGIFNGMFVRELVPARRRIECVSVCVSVLACVCVCVLVRCLLG